MSSPWSSSQPPPQDAASIDPYGSPAEFHGAQPLPYGTPAPQYGAQPLPYGTPAPPYGAQPYGAQPYGAQPYGAQPYGAQPYGAQPYGADQYYGAQPAYYGVPRKPGTNGFAVASLIIGILGGFLSIIFGHIALSQIKKTGQEGKGMAIAGLVFGYLWLLFWVIVFFAALADPYPYSSY